MKRILLSMVFLLSGIIMSYAQALQVNGIVVDEAGAPVIGATVMVQGTTTGVITNVDGSFTITAPNSESILVISFLGLEEAEVKAESNMTVVLKSSATAIEQVVVTGMSRVDRRLFTGATDRLLADDIKMDGVPDISRALEGRSAGVSVQNVSATFGTAPKIRIRGATSILGNSKPLWVVDGVIMEDVTEITNDQLSSGDATTLISSAIAGLNADDIESFQILKDGSATSIYGARAMAGVIVVTTKRGRAGQTKVNYTGEFTTRLKPSYNEYNIMNSQNQMSVYQELENKGYLNLSETLRAQKSGVYGNMYRLINTYYPDQGVYALANTRRAMNSYLRDAEYRNTDWFDILFKNSVMQNHSVSISTGTDKSTSYMSLSVMTDPGWYIRSQVDRYTLNANSSYNILPNLTIYLLGSASYRRQEAPGTVGQEEDPYFGEVKRDFDINPFSYAMNTSRTMDPDEYYTRNYTEFNILNELQNNYIRLNNIDAKFQGELRWTIIPGLDISALGSLKYNTTSMQHFIKDNANQAMAYREMSDATIRSRNPWLYQNPDDPNSLKVSIMEKGGIYEKRELKARSYDFRTTVNWNKSFDNTHIVHAMGAMELNSLSRMNDWSRGYGMQYNQGEIPFYNYLAFKYLSENNADYYSLLNTTRRYAAFVGTGTYSYMGKYTLTGVYRYEGTNRMGKSTNARWLPTWNISGGWNVHEEGFFNNNVGDWFSHLNLKASYSLTADAGPDYVTNSTAIINSYIPWRPVAGDRESGLAITYVGNEDLTYEKKHELNIGLSAGFLDNRINLEADVYWRNNYDLIGYTTTQGVSGEVLRYANVADMKSNGVEFTLSTRNIVTRDFRWTTDLTFSYAKNKVTRFDTDANVLKLILGTGYSMENFPVNSLFSIPFIGLDNEGMPMYSFNGETVTKNEYSDIYYQQTRDLDFLIYEGPTDPKYTGGFGNVFSYKNFRLNVFMTYGFGNVVRLNPVFNYRYTDLDSSPNEFKNRWMAPGDENHTNIPTIVSARQYHEYGSGVRIGYNAYNYSSVRVAKGDFIRMKEISLSYDFPKQMIQSIKMNDLSLKIQVTNPFLIYADKKLNGQDPEYYQSGGVSSPLAKQFTFTVRIGF